MQLDTLILPDNFLWVNEFEWSPVAQTSERSLTGALVVSEREKSWGRSIVLGDGENSWITRQQLEELFLLSAFLNHKMDLVLPDGRTFTVIFDRSNSEPLEAYPINPHTRPSAEDSYAVVIRLLTVDRESL